MQRRPLLAVLSIGVALAIGPRAAHADDLPQAAATVVAIDGDDLVIDLGGDKGLSAGDSVEIWRPLKIKHPVTGQVLTDRFKLGTLELGQVRSKLALARPRGALARQAAVGDLVVVAEAPRQSSPAPPPVQAAPGGAVLGGTAGDGEAERVMRLVEGLQGADPATRAKLYESYVHTHPESRYAAALRAEAAAFRRVARAVPDPARVASKSFRPVEKALEGRPIRVGIELEDGATGAVLQERRRGAPGFASVPMQSMGGRYYTATIPAGEVAPGGVEYFVEATGSNGVAVPVAGTPDSPFRTDVQPVPRNAPPPARPARVSVLTDYADYNRFRGNDRAWQTEGDVGIRLGDLGVRAVRIGFGVYRGVGGSVHELDDLHEQGRQVGLTYGYLETELGLARSFSFVGRGAVGLLDRGVGGGGQLFVRIGSDLKTNLLLGGEILGGVGVRSIAQVELAVFDRIPITLRTEVTNQPAGVTPDTAEQRPGVATGGDLGARGIAQIGYRVLPDLVVSARGSFQGRTIQHAGPGLGGGVTYSW